MVNGMFGILQIIGILFGLFMAYLTFESFKKRQLSRQDLFFWELIWLALIIFAAFSAFAFTQSEIFVQALGAVRLLDLLTIAGFGVILLIVFFMYKGLRASQAKLEQLVESLALKGLKEKKK